MISNKKGNYSVCKYKERC